ncbi:MAG: ribonuclease J [Candidatus Sumerlaeaceae bacterium]
MSWEPAHASSPSRLRIIPLGGLGEVGMNMMVYEYDDDIFVVDCGHTFPEDDLLGIDLVIPDLTYLEERASRLRGVVITHAHDDHLGALPYFLRKFNVPVVGTPLVCGILRERLGEFELDFEPKLREVQAGETFELGKAQIEFIHVTHSVPQSVALAIHLPIGTIVHTGDYKIDTSPIDARPFDFYAFARLGQRGVLALLADSTNVERPGRTPSERTLYQPLDEIFEQAPRTIFFSCFASALHRMQIVLDLAEHHRRKVFVAGLNMNRNLSVARELGVINRATGVLVDLGHFKKVSPDKRVVLTTGSQGEPLSALSRIAVGEHREVKIHKGDVAVLSSRIIPGNERAIYHVINHLFRRGADVYYEGVANVHVSGHAYRDDMATLIALCKPKFLIPIHGELRHLVLHKRLAVEMGYPEENVFILQNGDVLELGREHAHYCGRLQVSRVLVDGYDVSSFDEVVLRDRRRLSEDGMLLAVLAVEQSTGKLVAGPHVVSRGFLREEENEEFFKQCEAVARAAFEECAREEKQEWSIVKEKVRAKLKRFIKNETGRYPYILPVVLEI